MTADQLTTDTAGCSPVALAIAKRICNTDAVKCGPRFASSFDHAAFAAEVARMVDSELADIRTAAAFAALTVNYRDGIKHRMDLFTTDERNTLQSAAELLTPEG